MSQMRKVVSNTTSIIALSEIGRLNLLKDLFSKIYIPQAVFDEIKNEPAYTMVRDNRDWIEIVDINADQDIMKMYKSKLHAGEVESIVLAQSIGADLIILDDYAARKTAQYLGLCITGTMGVLIKAKQEGLIDRVKPLIEGLIGHGLFISDRVKQEILSIAGE